MLNQPFIKFGYVEVVMHRGIIEHDDGQRHLLLALSHAVNQIGDMSAF
ncbi:hypothetical protein [Methylomonas koyamae]|nr:hypothetical protein [Methylomonas koyamae]